MLPVRWMNPCSATRRCWPVAVSRRCSEAPRKFTIRGISDQELLDVAAEVLAQNYNKNTTGETFVDSMS